MEIIKKIDEVEFKKSKFCIELEYYYDKDLDEFYVDKELGNRNLRKIRNEYRRINNLLLDYNIKQIREKYMLSQKDFAILLGFGEVTITRYESKAVQDKAQDLVIRNASDPSLFLEMALNNKDRYVKEYSEDKFENVISIIKENISNNYVELEYSRRKFNENLVGSQELKLEKVYAVIKEYVKGIKKLTKTKLAKFLWYSDFLSYQITKNGMTGLSYCHLQYGAVPFLYSEILNSDVVKIEESIDGDSTTFLITDCDSEYHLNDFELDIIQKVIKKFKNMNTHEIVEYMHKEKAFIDTKNNEYISYLYANDIEL